MGIRTHQKELTILSYDIIVAITVKEFSLKYDVCESFQAHEINFLRYY